MTNPTPAAIRETCFLCEADHPWIYERSAHFVAMLGLGPIGEGYSLIAAREHVPSMLDLEPPLVDELVEFTSRVRARLRPHYGEAVVTEHGRIAPCLAAYARAYEPHCLHAHRLVFPGHHGVDLVGAYSRLGAQRYVSFFEAARVFDEEGQYLYAENADGTCEVVPVRGPVPRQFFRRLIAIRSGAPYLADWNAYPQLAVVAAAQHRLS